jgi:hypothetical protein
MKVVTTAAKEPLDFGNAATVFVDGLAHIDQVGPNSHLVFYMSQRNYDGPARVVVARLIVPTAELARMARQLACPDAAIDGPAANARMDEGGGIVAVSH